MKLKSIITNTKTSPQIDFLIQKNHTSIVDRIQIMTKQLGMSPSKARARLLKMILFDLAHRLNLDTCFQCGKIIEKLEEFTIEHKKPWLHVNPQLYWDIKNIAFSHYICNSAKTRPASSRCDIGYHWCNHCKQCLSATMFGRRKQKGYAALRNYCNPCRTIRRKTGLSW